MGEGAEMITLRNRHRRKTPYTIPAWLVIVATIAFILIAIPL